MSKVDGEEAMLEIQWDNEALGERHWLGGGSGNSFRHLEVSDDATSMLLVTCLKDLVCLNFCKQMVQSAGFPSLFLVAYVMPLWPMRT